MNRKLKLVASILGLAAITMSTAAPAQEWIPLQDGKSLSGWKAAEKPESWKVEDGVFVSRGDRSHLFYVGKVGKHDFKNFEFSAEVMTSPGANSGIYVHTKWQGPGWPAAGYELQVINSNPPVEKPGDYIEYKMTGSVYAVRNTWVAPAKDNVWFNYRIRVVGKTIQTFINDELVSEYAESASPSRADDKKGRVLGSGTFALQAHDPGSVVKYRNMKVKILPNDAAPPAGLVPIADAALEQLVSQASNDNIPLVDLGLSPPSGDTTEYWRQVRRLGITPGGSYPTVNVTAVPASVLLINDEDKPVDVALLKAAKAAGVKVAFSSGGVFAVDEAKFAARLTAIKEAGLDWKDFWIPGRP